MNIARPSFSENGYHADAPPIYATTPRKMPRLRWIAVASVVMLILMGVLLSRSQNEEITPTASVGQTDSPPVGQQADECTVQPQTGWIVHIVGDDESVAQIAETYHQSEETLINANCLEDEAVEVGQVVYIPTQLSTVWIAREPIEVGSQINEEIVQSIYVVNSDADLQINTNRVLGSYSLIHIPQGSVIDNQFLTTLPAEIEYEGETFAANEAEVVTIVQNSAVIVGSRDSGTSLFVPNWRENNCIPFMHSNNQCSDIEFNPDAWFDSWSYSMPIPITILHQDSDASVISLTQEDALILDQIELLYPDTMFAISAQPERQIQRDHVAIAIPMDKSHEEQLEDIEWNQAIGIELEFQFCEIETLEVTTSPIILDEDMPSLCDEDDLQTETHTISAVLLLQSVIVGNNNFAGMVTVSVTPQDAVTLQWAIEAGININFLPIND